MLSVLRELAKDAKDPHVGVIPVCGAGFSVNARRPYQPKQWKDLIKDVLDARDARGLAIRSRISPRKLNDVQFLHKQCEDYVTALSLLAEWEPDARQHFINSIERVTHGVTRAALPVHQIFWSADWPLVITTNYDNFLSVSCGHSLVLDYSASDLTRRVQQDSKLEDANVVVHLHGSFKTGAPPLVTWQDYLEGYGWLSPNDIEDLARFMIDTSGLVSKTRKRYDALLRAQLSRAADSARRGGFPGRVPQVIDDLLSNKTCLFIGFSFVDPIWRLVLHKLQAGSAAGKHFMIAKNCPPVFLRKVVHLVPITSFSEVPRLLDLLSAEMGCASHAGSLGEGRARENHYRDLQVRYPEFARRTPTGFIAQGKNVQGIRTVVPFTEVWCNHSKLSPETALKVQNVALERFLLARQYRPLRTEYWKYRARVQKENRGNPGGLINEPKMRVCCARTTPRGHLLLDVQLADYMDFFVTNHLVANMDYNERGRLWARERKLVRLLDEAFITDGYFDPRAVLCGDEQAIALRPAALCSNHLGASLLIIAELPDGGNTVPALLCPPTTGQICSPKDIVMTCSGSIDWPLARDARNDDDLLSSQEVQRNPGKLRLPEQVWREFSEECLYDEAQAASLAQMPPGRRMEKRYRIAREGRRRWIFRSALINLCQNIERGGKPELFYIASIRGSGVDFINRTFEPNWELMPIHSTEIAQDVERARGQRRMMCLRSPLDRHLHVIGNPEPAYKQLLSVILDSRFNPVLRAHLVSVLRWCLILVPQETANMLTTLGTPREFYLVGCNRA